MDEANDTAQNMKRYIDDQFFEGGLVTAFNDFISDLTTYPVAVLKGPVVRRQRQLDWVQGPDGAFAPQVQEKLAPTYNRVDPFRFYVEPGITKISDGYTIEHHKLSEGDLSDLIGVPGYDDGAIRTVLDQGANVEWLWSAEMMKSELENKFNIWRSDTNQFDALEFWGRVRGKHLIDWGMDRAQVPDVAKEYQIEAWQIGEFEGEEPMRVPTAPIRTLVFVGAALTALQFGVLLVEHLLDLGRRDALQRVAHYLLELGARLRLVGLGSKAGYDCPISQYLLADVLGLSAVHVNRVLRQLREQGLLTFRDGKVTFDDLAGLVALAEFDPSYLDQDGPLFRR
jgi:hypothetical protein